MIRRSSYLSCHAVLTSIYRQWVGDQSRCVRHLYDDVFQQGVLLDGVVDLWFMLVTKVDRLRIAAALEVEDPVIIPSWNLTRFTLCRTSVMITLQRKGKFYRTTIITAARYSKYRTKYQYICCIGSARILHENGRQPGSS